MKTRYYLQFIRTRGLDSHSHRSPIVDQAIDDLALRDFGIGDVSHRPNHGVQKVGSEPAAARVRGQKGCVSVRGPTWPKCPKLQKKRQDISEGRRDSSTLQANHLLVRSS